MTRNSNFIKRNEEIGVSSLSVVAYRMMLYILETYDFANYAINKKDVNSSLFDFNVAGFQKACKQKYPYTYEDMVSCMQELMNLTLRSDIKDQEGVSVGMGHFIPYLEYYDKNESRNDVRQYRKIRFALSPWLIKEYQALLKGEYKAGGFGVLPFEEVVQLRSMYSQRLYALLFGFKHLKKKTFTIQFLRERLQVPKTAHPTPSLLMKNIIVPAMEEISNKTVVFSDLGYISPANGQVGFVFETAQSNYKTLMDGIKKAKNVKTDISKCQIKGFNKNATAKAWGDIEDDVKTAEKPAKKAAEVIPLKKPSVKKNSDRPIKRIPLQNGIGGIPINKPAVKEKTVHDPVTSEDIRSQVERPSMLVSKENLQVPSPELEERVTEAFELIQRIERNSYRRNAHDVILTAIERYKRRFVKLIVVNDGMATQIISALQVYALKYQEAIREMPESNDNNARQRVIDTVRELMKSLISATTLEGEPGYKVNKEAKPTI